VRRLLPRASSFHGPTYTGADLDTGLNADLDMTMANKFYAGLHAGGSAALRGAAALRVNCVQTARGTPGKLERAKGFQPSTPTLARLRSGLQPENVEITNVPEAAWWK